MVARKVAVVSAVVACLLAGAGATQAAPGDLDPTFGTGGIVHFDFGLRELANGIAIQPDGKLVLGGSQLNNATAATSLLVARLSATGALDTGFGQGKGFNTLGTADSGEGIVLQPDGQILVAGSRGGSSSNMLVARFNSSDGALDPSFGGTLGSPPGVASPPVFGSEFAHAITLAPSGKILLAGHQAGSSSSDLIVARLDVPTGTLDSSFDVAGGGLKRTTSSSAYTVGQALALGADGTVFAVGSAISSIGTPSHLEFDRFNVSGGGTWLTTGLEGEAKAVAIQPDGNVVVAGYAGNPVDFVVMRKVPNNFSADFSFGSAGVERIDLGGVDIATAMALQPDGKILVAGTTDSGATRQAAVVRLQPNGLPDTTFGHNGSAVIPFPGGGKQSINAMALRKDGTILLAGSTTPGPSSGQDLLVMRLEGDNGPGGDGTGGGGGGGPVGGGPGGGTGGAVRVPRCEGRKATIVGTRRADKLKGTRRADVIVALGGNDRIDGKGGNDLICAGAGNDVVIGGAGNDRVDGGDGKDKLSGGDGKDVLAGQGGKDVLKGGPGGDTLKGGAGRDLLVGGRGRNRLRQ